jgi:diguanylate cyclase (GGDEF)-like protein
LIYDDGSGVGIHMPEKILFVESDKVFLDTYKKYLSQKYPIDAAADAATGLKKIRKEGPYTVVIADLMMKDMDGIKFFSKVKELSADTIRIMLTGNPELDIAVNAVNEGDIFRFITKPFDLQKFYDTIDLGIAEYNRIERLKRESLKDSLTGLWNRRYFESQVRKVISASKRFSHPFSLIYFDVDNFKDINDRFGHAAGDNALVLIANVMTRTLRAHDTLFRLGGDEFAILAENSPRENALGLVNRIKKVMASKKIEGVPNTKVVLSVGIAVFPEDGFEKDVLMYVADQAMYRDKEVNKKER